MSVTFIRKKFFYVSFLFFIFESFYAIASVKQTSCDYNLVTFDLMYKTQLPPQHYRALWGLAIPDISLNKLRLIPYNLADKSINNTIIKILNLNQLLIKYPISNTYIENNIKFILADQFKLLKSLKDDKEKLKQFREQTKRLLMKFLKDTELYNKYENFIKSYTLHINFYYLTKTITNKSIKKAQLLQSSSPYQSIKLTPINNNTQMKQQNTNSSNFENDTFINFIINIIKITKDNWWIILGVLVYIYVILILLKRR